MMDVESFNAGGMCMPRPKTKRTPRPPKELAGLGRILKQVRQRRGMSQAGLGKRLGMPQRTISNYESGVSRVPSNLLPKFAETLRVSVAELLGQRPTPGADKGREIWKFVNQVETLPPKDKRAVFRYVEALSGANGGRRAA